MIIILHKRILVSLMALLVAFAPLQAGWRDWFDKSTISGRTALVATSAAALAVISYIVYKRWNPKTISSIGNGHLDHSSDASAKFPVFTSSQNSELSNHEFVPWADAQLWNEQPLIPLQQYAVTEYIAWSGDRTWIENQKCVKFSEDVVDGTQPITSTVVGIRRPWQDSFDKLCAHLMRLVIAKKDVTFLPEGRQSQKFSELLLPLYSQVIVCNSKGQKAFEAHFVATFNKLDLRITGILRNMSPYIEIDPVMKFCYDSTKRWIDAARSSIELLMKQQIKKA